MSEIIDKLTERQRKFCQNIADGQIIKLAASNAGYTKSAASSTAAKLLVKEEIKAAIEYYKSQKIKHIEEKASVSVSWRVKKLQKIVELGMNTNEAGDTENLNAAISAIKVINEMLGINEKKTAQPVKVVLGVEDASMPDEDFQEESYQQEDESEGSEISHGSYEQHSEDKDDQVEVSEYYVRD